MTCVTVVIITIQCQLYLNINIILFTTVTTLLHCVHKKWPPFYFSNNCQKLTDFNVFWCVTSRENLTLIACTFLSTLSVYCSH